MTIMRRRRFWYVTVLLLLLAVALVMRSMSRDTDGMRATLRGGAPTDAARVHVLQDSESSTEAGAPTSVLSVHVDVVPAGGDLEWRADVYLLPTRARPERAVIGGETRSGTGFVSWDVPCERIGIHVHSEHGFGGIWRELQLVEGVSMDVPVQLHAPGRLEGTVGDSSGRGLSDARVIIVPTEDLPVPRGPTPARAGARTDELSVETNADGAYVIEDIDPRTPYHAAAARPGFAVRRAFGLRVPAGGVTQHDFALDTGCRVTGRLLDAEGGPIANARLDLATVVEQSESSIVWDREGQSVTGSDGRFAFDSLNPGWKKIQTVLAAEKGSTTVGHWECRVERGEVGDFGDLVLSSSLFEVELRDPEGMMERPEILLYMLPEPSAGVSAQGAMLTIPVVPDDSGTVRVHSLPRGRVMGVVRDATHYEEEMWRPRTDFEEHFDGTTASHRWTVNPLQEGKLEQVDVRGARVASVSFDLPKDDDESVALVFVNGELQIIRKASGGFEVSGGVGDAVRLVLTEGERWGEHELLIEEGAATPIRPEIRPDRLGYTLEIRVEDDGRAVPGAMVLVGPAVSGKDGLLPFMMTERDGRAVLAGLPPDTDLVVTAKVFRTQPEPQRVEWIGGRATVVIDVGDQ